MAKRRTKAELMAQIESAKNELAELEQEECMAIGHTVQDVFKDDIEGMNARQIKKFLLGLKALNDRQKVESESHMESSDDIFTGLASRQNDVGSESEEIIESSAGDIPGSPLF